MLPDGKFDLKTLSAQEATEFFSSDFENVANPSHANTLDAVSKRLEINVRDAKGGRVFLNSGDQCLVAEISGVPRVTREFTDEEIVAATFRFRLLKAE